MKLLTRLVGLAREAADAPDIDALKVRVLYNVAAAVGDHIETRPIRQGLGGDSGPGSTAFHLASAMHARTQDDFYPAGRVHVGTAVLPAVLAVGEDGLFPALAAGYEVLAAVAAAYSKRAQERGYRPTGIFGPIGAAAAAAVALRLDDQQMASALALASVMAGGTNQAWIDGTDEWVIEVGSAARAGVDAARLAAAGMRGAPHAFDGSAGWAAAFFDDKGATLLERSLDRQSRRTAEVAIKLYPVSGIAQVPTYLAGELGTVFEHVEPERIEVRMPSQELDYPGSRNRGPFKGRADSLMSIARCVALSYLHGSIPYRVLLQAPDVRELALIRTVDLVADPDFEETEATVTITVRGCTERRRAYGGELLYPGWERAREDATEIARRCEAPVDLVAHLAETIEEDFRVATLRTVLETAP